MKKKEYKICSAAVCHKGMVRDKNQDNLYFKDTFLPLVHEGTDGILVYDFDAKDKVWLGIFDGMGGETDGELASYIAVSNFANMFREVPLKDDDLFRFFNQLNQIVCETSRARRISQMGTTASLACFDGDYVCVSNLGDSPIYLFYDDGLELISELHTNEKMLKANNINRKPGLTQFLGLDYEGMLLEPSVNRILLKEHDIFLICSDGLTDMLSKNEIENILRKEAAVGEKVGELLNLALEKGAVDNTTIILCEVKREKKKRKIPLIFKRKRSK